MGKIFTTEKGGTWEYGTRAFNWHVWLGPCPSCGARCFDYGGGWRCIELYCENSANNLTPSLGPRPNFWFDEEE